MGNRYCSYIRVSTRKQSATNLGLSAQQKICDDYIASQGGTCVKEFQDVESGTHRNRKGLWDAIEFCKANKCTLVIAKLDRLARDVEFTFHVISTGIQIYICDMPVINTLTLGVFATVAQYERELCSGRTKAALNEIKEQISQNGGHMSKAGRWVKHLGRKKGVKMPGVAAGAAIAATKRANDWREESALYTMVAFELSHNTPQKEILEKALELYDKNPAKYCTRNGKPLCWGTLSRWARELKLNI